MPVATADGPTISQIYDAFDAHSHMVFRHAMAHSRGGVVRIGDLIEGFRTGQTLIAPEFMGLLPSTTSPRTDDDASISMSNEPALREVLHDAFVLAQAQPNHEIVITQHVLLCALLRRSAVALPIRLETVLALLGLEWPADWRVADPPSARMPSSRPLISDGEGDESFESLEIDEPPTVFR